MWEPSAHVALLYMKQNAANGFRFCISIRKQEQEWFLALSIKVLAASSFFYTHSIKPWWCICLWVHQFGIWINSDNPHSLSTETVILSVHFWLWFQRCWMQLTKQNVGALSLYYRIGPSFFFFGGGGVNCCIFTFGQTYPHLRPITTKIFIFYPSFNQSNPRRNHRRGQNTLQDNKCNSSYL